MVHAKNYETVYTFVKLCRKKNRGLFFSGHGVLWEVKMFQLASTLKVGTECLRNLATACIIEKTREALKVYCSHGGIMGFNASIDSRRGNIGWFEKIGMKWSATGTVFEFRHNVIVRGWKPCQPTVKRRPDRLPENHFLITTQNYSHLRLRFAVAQCKSQKANICHVVTQWFRFDVTRIALILAVTTALYDQHKSKTTKILNFRTVRAFGTAVHGLSFLASCSS